MGVAALRLSRQVRWCILAGVWGSPDATSITSTKEIHQAPPTSLAPSYVEGVLDFGMNGPIEHVQ